MKFGRFGREDGTLVLVMQGGALAVKILKRTVTFESKDPNPGPPKAQMVKLNIPKKTKVFVDQTVRERENPVGKLEGKGERKQERLRGRRKGKREGKFSLLLNLHVQRVAWREREGKTRGERGETRGERGK